MSDERFVVVVDQLDQRPAQLQAHLWIDNDFEGARARIGHCRSFRRGAETS